MTNQEFKQLRKEMGMNQMQLAQLLDVEQSAISRWETGTVPVTRMVELALRQLHRTETTPTAPSQDWLLVSVDWRAQNREKYLGQEMLTNAQAADYLGINRHTLLDWVKAGLLPEPVIGYAHDGHQDRKTRSYRRADLDAFLVKDAQRKGRRILRT